MAARWMTTSDPRSDSIVSPRSVRSDRRNGATGDFSGHDVDVHDVVPVIDEIADDCPSRLPAAAGHHNSSHAWMPLSMPVAGDAVDGVRRMSELGLDDGEGHPPSLEPLLERTTTSRR